MTSALMEADDSPIISENDLESQILSSQESMVRLNRELDNALLRITTLENICSENQIDLHEKRTRIKELINEIDEREETNEQLTQELNDKNELIKQYRVLFEDFGNMSTEDLRSQIQFDRQLRELILDNQDYSIEDSPQEIINQFHQNQRLKFHDLLQESLITEDISQLIDSDDILFGLLTRLNSLSRLRETLSRDSKQIQHIRSVLHLPTDNYEQLITDLLTKRESIEYLRSKIDINPDLTDLGLIKHLLHDYFNFQQQQIDLKEYLQINNENENDLNYSRILIERCNELNHINEELNQRIQTISNQSITPEPSIISDQIEKLKTEVNQLKPITNSDDNIDEETPTLDNEQQIKQIADQFSLHTDDHEESDLTRIQHSLQFLTDFRQSILDKMQEKQDAEIQTIDHDEFYLQIKELLGIEETYPDAIIDKIKELLETSQSKIDEIENYHRLINKLGLSSETSIDEICNIFDTFCLEYRQSTSTNFLEIFKQIQTEITQLKTLIYQIDFNTSSDECDYIAKLQRYITKVENLCQLITHENTNIDQALIIYRTKTEQDDHALEKISDFKRQLLTRLSIESEEQIFNRLDEITGKLQNSNDFASTLNTQVSEQQAKILEYEDTVEKLRSQRERMLSKMKEIKTNNESLATQIQKANQSIDELHRKEIDYKNQIESIEQQLRSANTQMLVSLDDSQTQQDLQETMKLEIDSLKNEIETQKKLYENRCRQIINEKKQLDKISKEFLEEKQIVEEENKQLQTILQTIKDSLENVDDIHSIVDGISKLHHNLLNLRQKNEQIQNENEKLLTNIVHQESTIRENFQTKTELEKRLIDTDQQLFNLKKQIEEHIEQYQILQKEFHSYKEDHPLKSNQQVAMINIEQSPTPIQPHLLAVQQAADLNNWMTIDMKDEEIPTTVHKHSTMDTSTAILNLLGELKSKLGITLTHRPRSSSVFFIYLCAVHLLTIYLLFFSHC